MPLTHVSNDELRDAIFAPHNRHRRLQQNLQSILIQVLDERVPVKEGGPTGSKREVILQNLIRLAGEGNAAALRFLRDFFAEEKRARAAEAYAERIIEPNILKAAEEARVRASE